MTYDNIDQIFILLVFIVASGLIAFGGFLIACGFVALTEGKQKAKEFFLSEW